MVSRACGTSCHRCVTLADRLSLPEQDYARANFDHRPRPVLDRLSAIPAPPDSVNPWSSETVYGQIRLQNLRRYFAQLLERGVDTLMLGEAPGYLGCRRTGVGFTSEPQLIGGISTAQMFGAERGYQLSGEFPDLRKEQSATIVWGELTRLDFVPLVWAAFPFHPHKPDRPTLQPHAQALRNRLRPPHLP